MEPNKVPLEYSHRWILCAMKLGERHYTLFLICGLIIYITSFIVSAIPYVGSIFAMVLGFMYLMGSLRLSEQVIKHQKGSIDDFLKFAFDVSYFQRFKMQLGILVAVGITMILITLLKFFVTTTIGFIFSTTLTQLLGFSAFMMFLSPELKWTEALEKVFNGFTLNLGPWIIALLLLSAFALVSIVLCLAPFLLYFVPMTYSFSYLLYASIYENLNIESLITEWSSKPPIETHTLPPEA